VKMREAILIVLFSVAIIGLGTIAQCRVNQRREVADALRKDRDGLCQRLQWDLEAIVRSSTARNDLRIRMQYHHLDQGLMQLCFGKPIVIDSSACDSEWIKNGDERCYLEVARDLLNAYRAR